MPFAESHTIWIVGYGNRQRRDDGVGPAVVAALRRFLEPADSVHLLAVPQLSADLVEELKHAGSILFIDAAMNDPACGRTWYRLYPDRHSLPTLTHHIRPAQLLGLLEALYDRSVPAWLISVGGKDFEFGEGLSREAARAAGEVQLEILAFIGRKNYRSHQKIVPADALTAETS